MLVRKKNGIIVDIKRIDFITDISYYEYIMNII